MGVLTGPSPYRDFSQRQKVVRFSCAASIATHILDYGDEGKVTFYEGNFSDYEEWKKKTLGEAATQPHRIKYKRIGKIRNKVRSLLTALSFTSGVIMLVYLHIVCILSLGLSIIRGECN